MAEDRRCASQIATLSKTSKNLLILLLLPLINIITSTYIAYDDIKIINQDYVDTMSNISEARWILVESLIQENENKARIQTDNVRDRVESNLLSKYANNLDQLKLDLEPSQNNNPALDIMNEAISDKYLNVENDSNDMFIATNKGVLVDKSINCSIGKLTRTWEEEIPLHAEPQLATQVIKLLLQQSNTLKVWQFEPHTDPLHIHMQQSSMEDVKKVYTKEGIKGLEKYEFLTASYIKKDRDIFGELDVNHKGLKNDNYKLIIVQGFNVVDLINKLYLDKIAYFTSIEKSTYKESMIKKSETLMKLFMSLALLITSFIGIALTTKIIIRRDDVG